MKIINKRVKKSVIFIKRTYILSLFLALVILSGSFFIYKSFFSTSNFAYVKIKMDQGYYTEKPSAWIINALDNAKNSAANTNNTQIISEEHYPYWQPDQMDIYVIAKLPANFNRNTGEYSYNHSTLSIGSPIQLHLRNLDISGTVIDLNNQPFKYKYVYKTVYLVDKGGYNKDFPYMYSSINIGDKYFDGSNTVFEVLDKSLEKNILGVQNNLNGQIYEQAVETTQNVVIKAKVRVRQASNQFIYGEVYELTNNNSIPFSTNNYFLSDFVIRNID